MIVFEQRFLFKWVLLNYFGWRIASYVAHSLTTVAFSHANNDPFAIPSFQWAIFGVIFSLLQWFGLRDKIPASLGWVFATTTGLYFAALSIVNLSQLGILKSIFLAQLLTGIILGVTQYIIIRRFNRAVSRIFTVAPCWIFVSQLIVYNDELAITLGLLLFAVPTGIILSWILLGQSSETNLLDTGVIKSD